MPKRVRAATWANFIRDGRNRCVAYWLAFCAVEYVRHGHFNTLREFALAAVFGLLTASLLAWERKRQQKNHPPRPVQPAA